MRSRDPLATHNERVKLQSAFLNNIGLGFIGFAVLRPLVENTARFDGMFFPWMATGLVLHLTARYILRYLEKED